MKTWSPAPAPGMTPGSIETLTSVPVLGTIETHHTHVYELSHEQLLFIAAEVAERIKPVEPEEVLTTPEAAEFIRCSKSKLSELVRDEQLPVIRLDSSNRFFKSDLVAYLRQRREGAPQ